MYAGGSALITPVVRLISFMYATVGFGSVQSNSVPRDSIGV